MNLYQPTISGSLVVSGSVSVIGPFTMSGGSITGTASFASNSGLLSNLDSSSFVGTGSFNTMSSSVSTRVTTIESKYATTGSNIFTGAQTVCANITSTGTIIAQTLNVQQVTSSIVYSSGSNVFGCSLSNTQQFTGSVTMTGSLAVFTAGTTPEFQVAIGGTTHGNALTDVHQVTGSLRITGSNALFNVGCVGIGNISPAANLHVLTPSTGTGVIFRYTGGTNNPGLFVSTEESTKYVRLTASGTSVAGQLLQLGAEGTAGVVNVGVANVGIGTPTNLNQRLTIVDSNDAEALGVYRCFSAASDAGTYVRLGALNGSCVPTAGAAIFGALEGAKTSGYLSFFTYCGSTAFERMRINSNGQAGIGVTPSAWGNTIKALQVASFGSISSTGGIDTQISNNAYYDGTDWRYIAAQEAANYYMNRDTHVWRYRTAGGAGATITWCEAMRLTNVGELLLGSTTRVTGLSGFTQFEVSSPEAGIVINSTCTTANRYSRLMFTKSGATGNEGLIRYNVNDYHMSFWTNANERIRITCNGNVGIGDTVIPSGYGRTLQITSDSASDASFVLGDGSGTTTNRYLAARPGTSASFIFGTDCGSISFRTGLNPGTSTGNEKMSISSTGNVAINAGDFTVSGNITLSTGANRILRLGSGTAYYYDLQSVGDNFEIREAGTTTRMKIFYPSGITCFSSTICAPCFATISDYRMKSNIRPIDGLSIIMNTKPYKFDYNYDCAPSFGMIAHELQEVVPEAVFGEKDGENMQGVDYMKLLPISIKAIQEQQCIINQLRCENNIFKTCLGIS